MEAVGKGHAAISGRLWRRATGDTEREQSLNAPEGWGCRGWGGTGVDRQGPMLTAAMTKPQHCLKRPCSEDQRPTGMWSKK